MARKKKGGKTIATLSHGEAKRKNIPTAEYHSVMDKEKQQPVNVTYERNPGSGEDGLKQEKEQRNPDIDPQLIWRGKSDQPLDVPAPPLYIQEKVHPKVLIDDLLKRTEKDDQQSELQVDMFADFNGVSSEAGKTEFYQHDQNWTNRMILGDSLQVMASLSEREGLRGKVQCIYLDPPYGIKFNSNFQWSTRSNDVKDGIINHITREPEQVKAFRDTWRDGKNSYLTYLRDRLIVTRDLLADSGSLFVQIGDENVHLVRGLLDEIYGSDQFISQINFKTKKMALGTKFLGTVNDHIIWYSKNIDNFKFKRLFLPRNLDANNSQYKFAREPGGKIRRIKLIDELLPNEKLFRTLDMHSSGRTASCVFDFSLEGSVCSPRRNKSWKTNKTGIEILKRANRLIKHGKSPEYELFVDDYPVQNLMNVWEDTQGASGKRYVVETSIKPIQRCVLMATDPGDLVIDPTCGSGTTAYVAEQWGRRWITIDTSRVSLALARARIMGARYPYYLLVDSKDGQQKEAEITRTIPTDAPTFGNIAQGFVYNRVPHITLKSIAHNTNIDEIWEDFQTRLEPLRESFNNELSENWEEWEIPREVDESWSADAIELHEQWWEQRITRQKEIDADIAARAAYEYLYDKPYEDKSKVRVAGPFTVESLSPHRVLGLDENDELIDSVGDTTAGYGEAHSFVPMILENLKTAGVQQAHKENKIDFTSLVPWPGDLICAEGLYLEGDEESGEQKRAGIFIGPEFGTVSRPDLVAAAREAGDADFDVLITCAFNYDAHSSEFDKLGRIPVLKARMNADLHMADDLKNTGKGNLFVIFGEPDIDIIEVEDNQIQVKVNGVDVFHPSTGKVQSDNADGIACWFIDTDYNEESFFVRHAYFLGAGDPYKSLKTTLKAEINQEAWDTLNSDTSRPFDKPESGRIAVKVINHLGDEVMKVFGVA